MSLSQALPKYHHIRSVSPKAFTASTANKTSLRDLNHMTFKSLNEWPWLASETQLPKDQLNPSYRPDLCIMLSIIRWQIILECRVRTVSKQTKAIQSFQNTQCLVFLGHHQPLCSIDRALLLAFNPFQQILMSISNYNSMALA